MHGQQEGARGEAPDRRHSLRAHMPCAGRKACHAAPDRSVASVSPRTFEPRHQFLLHRLDRFRRQRLRIPRLTRRILRPLHDRLQHRFHADIPLHNVGVIPVDALLPLPGRGRLSAALARGGALFHGCRSGYELSGALEEWVGERGHGVQALRGVVPKQALREVDGFRGSARREDAVPREGLERGQIVCYAGRVHGLKISVGRCAEQFHNVDQVLLRRVLPLKGQVA